MCHDCRAQELVLRIERQLKNIDAGGAVSLDGLRSVLAAAGAEINRRVLASSLADVVLSGIPVDVVTPGEMAKRH